MSKCVNVCVCKQVHKFVRILGLETCSYSSHKSYVNCEPQANPCIFGYLQVILDKHSHSPLTQDKSA